MTAARESHERPRRAAAGQPGPTWAGDGRWADGPAVQEIEEPPAVAVAVASERARAAAPAGLELASFQWRAVGFVVDNIIVLILLYLFNAVAGLSSSSLVAGDTVIFSVLSILAQVAYWWVWNTIGWSPGKRVVGLRIVGEDGAAPGLDRGFRRTVISLLSGMALFAGYLWALWDSRNQTWHDKAGETFVVVASSREQRPL